MKKPILIVVIIFLLAVIDIGSTYYVGISAEKTYRSMVKLLDDTPGIQASVISFQRGFFSSEAYTEIVIGQSKYTIQDTLIHGPVAFDFKNPLKTKIALGLVHSTILTNSLDVPITADIVFPFAGGALLSSEGLAYQFKDQSVLSISGTGWKATGEVNPAFDSYTFHNIIPMMTIMSQALGSRDKTEIKDQEVDIHYQKHKQDSDGNLKVIYSVGNITNTGQGSHLSKLKIEGKMVLNTETFDTFFQGSFDKMTVKEDIVGPAIIQFNIKNVDLKLFDLIKKLTLRQPVTPLEIQNVIRILFKRGFEIQVEDLKTKLKQGQLAFKGKMNLGGAGLKEPITTDNVIASSEGEMYLSIPKTLFQELLRNDIVMKLAKDPNFKTLSIEEQEQKISTEMTRLSDALKANQYMTETLDANIIQFSFSKGRYQVGGKEVPKPEFN